MNHTLRILQREKREGAETPLCATCSHTRAIQGGDPCHIRSLTIIHREERSNPAGNLHQPVTLLRTLGSRRSLTHGLLPNWAQSIITVHADPAVTATWSRSCTRSMLDHPGSRD